MRSTVPPRRRCASPIFLCGKPRIRLNWKINLPVGRCATVGVNGPNGIDVPGCWQRRPCSWVLGVTIGSQKGPRRSARQLRCDLRCVGRHLGDLQRVNPDQHVAASGAGLRDGSWRSTRRTAWVDSWPTIGSSPSWFPRASLLPSCCVDVIRDYCDVAVSGRRESRPRLNALMTAARNHEIDCVLVWKFDRFARSTRHLLAALEESTIWACAS
jgi:hypothetical protein